MEDFLINTAIDLADEYYPAAKTYTINKSKEAYRVGTAALLSNPKYFALACLIEIIILWLIFYKWSPFNISENHPSIVALVMLISMTMNVMLYAFVDDKARLKKHGITIDVEFMDVVSKVGFTILGIFIIFATVWLILKISGYPIILSVLKWILKGIFGFGTAGIFFAVIYLIFKPYIDAAGKQGSKSTFSLIGNLIMYIPCALIDLIDRIKYEYDITTNTTWILLGLEVILIAFYIFIPKALAWYMNLDGKHLLKDPIYLDKETTIGKFDDFYSDLKQHASNSDNDTADSLLEVKNEDPSKDKKKYNYKYSISAWFWINPQPPNTGPAYTKYTNILEYGDKPVVEYNSLENSFRVRCKLVGDKYVTIYDTDNIKLQTWNNIVINYDGANMDVFLNGELVGSKGNIAPFMSYENLVVGEKNGIQGGIANVVYYNKLLYPEQINLAYKALKDKPIPLL